MPDGGVVEGLNLPTLTQSERQGSTTDPLNTEDVSASEQEKANGGTGEVVKSLGVEERAGTKKAVEGTPKPFLLSEGLPPVPAKLVGRILRGEFIDMAELLRDNLEAQRRGALQESPSTSSPSVGRPRREVPDLLSWVQCFGVYTAVIASKHPDRIQKLLAYQTLIIREARRCGGKGWLSYDSYFRQQMAGEWRGDEWGRLNPYLFSSTFLAFGGSHRPNCSLCLESDHQEEECALSKAKGAASSSKHLVSRDPPRDNSSRVNKGKTPRSTVCFSWNQGDCSYPYCKFRHACVRCGGDHKIIHCRSLGSLSDRRPTREKEGKIFVDGHSRSSQ